MAAGTRTIHVTDDSYALLEREAQRRGVPVDELADELVRTDLEPGQTSNLNEALDRLAEFRARLPKADAVALVSEARAELEAR